MAKPNKGTAPNMQKPKPTPPGTTNDQSTQHGKTPGPPTATNRFVPPSRKR